MMQRAKINNRMQQEKKRDNGHYVVSEKKRTENKAKSLRKLHLKRLRENNLRHALSEITGFCKEDYRE